MATNGVRTCPECGAELPAGTAAGQCPNCLLALGLVAAEVQPGDQKTENRKQKSEDGGQRTEGGRQGTEADNQPDANGPPLATRHSPLVTPFGDYELLEEIGHGGMGVVYKARQKSLDRIVALKLLLFGPHALPESVKRFRAEAVATAALQHPNIVAIHEVGLCAGQHFLVMDFVAGPSLARLIGNQPLPAKRAAGYVKTIAEAIHYAHERGLLHRDLKPSNILIDANDQPRVTDFGLAKRLVGDSELTVSGQVLGSPNYMPPEQASGKRGTVSRRSDVYALGAILYHALTGRPPFVAEGLADTVQQVLNVEPVSPRVLNPRLPADLETVCVKCLEKEPGKRYATAQMLAEELGRFLEGKAVLARPVGRFAKVWRWCRRNPRLATATGAALLSLLIGLAGVGWQWRRAERLAQAEVRQRARAEAEGLLARRNAYAADMKDVQRALDDSDLGHALELLDRYRPQEKFEVRSSKLEVDLRGWEWRYLWARCRSDERVALCQYSNAVTALAFSPDGKWLAVRRGNGAVALWETVAKRSVAEMPGGGYYKALAFAPRGGLLAWGNEDPIGQPVVSVRDLDARTPSAHFPLSEELVSVAFSPDTRAMATLAHDGAVCVWDVKSQTVLTNFATATVNVRAELFSAQPGSSQVDAYFSSHYGCVLFSPDGQWLAVGEAKPRIRLLDRITGKETVIPVPASTGGIVALAFSPDSKRLAAGCGFEDHQVYVWDLAVGAVARLAGHSGCIAGLAFSPDGQTLASVSTDQTLRLWDVARKVERRRFQGHRDEVWAVAWSPDGHDLVTGSKDGSVRYWDPTADPAPSHATLEERAWFWGPVFSPDCRSLLTVTRPRGSVVRWSVEREPNTWRRVGELPWLGTNHTSVDLSRDGRWLALGDHYGNIQVWDYPGHRFVTNLVSPGRWIFCLMFSPSGKILHCGTSPSNPLAPKPNPLAPKLYAVDGWREIGLRGVNLDNLFEADLSPDERTLAIAYEDGTVAWWDLATGRRQALCRFSDAGRIQVAFSAVARVFAAGSLDGQIRVWDVATRRVRPVAHGRRDRLIDLALSSDGRRLVASGTSTNDLVKIWDVETGREVVTLPGGPGLFVHIGFSPDGNTLFATRLEGTTLLWRAPSWAEIETKEKERRVP